MWTPVSWVGGPLIDDGFGISVVCCNVQALKCGEPERVCAGRGCKPNLEGAVDLYVQPHDQAEGGVTCCHGMCAG